MSDSFYVQWHILDRCNLRCLHCYQDSYMGDHEPGWPELRKAADNVLSAMACWDTKLDVALTGGEPFLKPELLSLLEYLDDSAMVGNLGVISNGTIWPRDARRFGKLAKFHDIRISLDGIHEESNDEIRGKGVLAKVLDNISRWQDLGIPVTVMFTVMKRNRHEVPLLLEFGKRLGIEALIIERFFPMGQAETLKQEMLDGPGFLGVWQTILGQGGIEIDPAELAAFRAIRVNFTGPGPDILGSGCVVGEDGAAILPDGAVLPCRRFSLPIGNVLNSSLAEIWRDSAVLNLLGDKSRLQGKCGKCPVKECRGCRAMCFCLSGDFLAEDPHCWLP